MRKFKTHPVYDQFQTEDWIEFVHPEEEKRRREEPSIEQIVREMEQRLEGFRGDHPALYQTVNDERQRICGLALARIQSLAGPDYLAGRLYPDVNEFSVQPTSNRGFQAYVEYAFFESPVENTSHTDSWWAIVSCPYALAPFPTKRLE